MIDDAGPLDSCECLQSFFCLASAAELTFCEINGLASLKPLISYSSILKSFVQFSHMHSAASEMCIFLASLLYDSTECPRNH